MTITPPATLAIRTEPGSTKGRSLHATRSFEAGDVIASLFIPIAVAHRKHAHSICAYCLTKAPPKLPGHESRLKKCAGCLTISYCGKPCQRADWRHIHSRECKLLAQLPQDMPSVPRALLQMIIHNPCLDWPNDLVAHPLNIQKANPARWDDIILQATAVAHFAVRAWDRELEEMDIAHAARGMAMLQANTFGDFYGDEGECGIKIEPVLAMANHSCVPNATVRNVGRMVQLMALVPIQEGQEVEISYADTTHPRNERRAHLKDYFFKCRCTACSGDLNAYDICRTSPAVDLNKGHVLRDYTKLREAPDVDAATRQLSIEARKAFKSAIKSGDQTVNASHGNSRELIERGLWALQPLPVIIEQHFKRLQSEFEPEVALALSCLFILRCLPYQHPSPYHPERANSLATLAVTIPHLVSMAGFVPNVCRSDDPWATIMVEIRGHLWSWNMNDATTIGWALGVVCLRFAPRRGPDDPEDDGVAMVREMVDGLADSSEWTAPEAAVNWRNDPDSPEGRKWFEDTVITKVEELAEWGAKFLRSRASS